MIRQARRSFPPRRMPLSHEPAPPERRRRRGRRDADEGNAYEEFWEGPANRDSRGPAPQQPAAWGQPVSGAYGGGAAAGPSTGAHGGGPMAGAPRTGAYPTAPNEGAYAADAYADDGYDEDYYEDEYDEYEGDDGEGLSRRRGCRAVLVTLVVLLIAAGVGAWFAWSWLEDEIDPAGEPGKTVLVEIPEGASTSDVGHELADAGVIINATVWDWYIRFRDPGEFQAGAYRMQLNSSFTEAIDALDEGALPPNAILITVPEGLTVTETLARLADPEHGVKGFTNERLQAALRDPASRSSVLPADQRSLEGTLFPESYEVEEGDTEAVVIQRMVAQLDSTLAELDMQGRAEALGLSPYQVLTVASLVEEEAGTNEDRPRVAQVIYNRLAEKMPLQIDATSCYVKNEPGGCSLTEADLASDSPYNTRNRQGLPPTPIASPGRASIEAALNPADGDWLYYVLDAEANDGSHVFTADYDKFVEARKRCADAGLGCGG
jgi:peptidoglycan lytic transglycosylase G